MGDIIYVPLGEFRPDLRLHSNDGLVTAENVVPVYGNYITSPATSAISANIFGTQSVCTGLHVHQETGVGYAGFDVGGGAARLFSINESGVVTDVSKAGLYNDGRFWYGCSFGQTVIMTNQRLNPVQYLPAGAGAFADLITSTFAPKAELCFPLGINLFLANCTTGAYDTLGAGDHPMLVTWSRNDDPRQFGSFNVNPEIIGAGYQDLLFDIGEIKAVAAANEFAVIGMSNGFVRIDGPPYTFKVLCRNIGVLWPYAMCVAGDDVYAWTQAGLARFRGGVGQPEILGLGKWTRFMIDNATGFSAHPFGTLGKSGNVSMAHDPLNNLLFVSYLEYSLTPGDPKAVLCYNISEDRASWFTVASPGNNHSCLFLRPGKQSESTWCPGRDIRFIDSASAGGFTTNKYSKWALGNSGSSAVLGKGYLQPKRDQSTRIVRIRPIYSATDQAAVEQVTVSIDTTNKPYGTPTTFGPYSSVDTHGWITTPTTGFGDWHAPKFTFTANANMHKVVEYEAFEAEVLIGPKYSA